MWFPGRSELLCSERLREQHLSANISSRSTSTVSSRTESYRTESYRALSYRALSRRTLSRRTLSQCSAAELRGLALIRDSFPESRRVSLPLWSRNQAFRRASPDIVARACSRARLAKLRPVTILRVLSGCRRLSLTGLPYQLDRAGKRSHAGKLCGVDEC